MPTLTFVESYPHPPAIVFAFFRRPANVLAVASAGSDIRLIDGPDEVAAGSTYTIELRKFGLTQRIETEVVVVDAPSRSEERQKQGPLRRLVLTRRFVATPSGTELTETIDFDPPGGLLGLVLTASTIEGELRQGYEGRAERVLAKLNAG